MSYKKDNKIKSNVTSITISLASPETILERSRMVSGDAKLIVMEVKLLFILLSFL